MVTRPQGTLSYVAGASDDPLKFMTIPQLLDRVCARNGAGDAAIFTASGQRLSWYDLRRKSDDVAASLLALGIKRGDRVGIWAPNRAEWLYAQFGTARIGAILVNVNPAYQRSELEYALNKVQCNAMIMARALKASDYLGMIRALAPEIETVDAAQLQAAKLPRLRHVIVLDEGPLPRGAMRFAEFLTLAGPAHASTRCPRRSTRTTPSISSLRPAPPARPRARRTPN